MKIRSKSWKRKMAAVMACVLMLSTTGIQSAFAEEENVNEEVILSPEEIEVETAEEIGMEENSAGINENLEGETGTDYKKTPANPVYNSATDSTVWDYVYFGGYPQTSVEVSDEIVEASYSSAVMK